MGLFGKKEGGLMDVIRCDEKDFLIWKWSPDGTPSRRENAIRYGSTLRVKDGEVAVFVYKQKDGTMQDYIEGPYDDTIRTANFPVLSGIVGAAFGGASPFPAEIYFINLSGNIQVDFFVGDIELEDPRLSNITVPARAVGTITFNITDYRSFIKLNRMIDFSLDEWADQVKSAVVRFVSDTIANAPSRLNLPAIKIGKGLGSINTIVQEDLRRDFQSDFGVNVKRVDLRRVELDKESREYQMLEEMTTAQEMANIKIQGDTYRQGLVDNQAIGTQNLEESLRIQREEAQRAQRLHTESANLAAHQINVQGDVAKTAAASLGELGSNAGSSIGGGGGGEGGMNPAAMMAGMMMGGAVAGSMSNMMGGMMAGVNRPQPPTPPVGATADYHVAMNGQTSGPYTLAQLSQMASAGQLTLSTHIWKAGMAAWDTASNVPEVSALFAATPPPPPMPGTPPPPPTGM